MPIAEDWSKHFRKTDLQLRDAVEAALAAPEPRAREEALCALVHKLFAAGHGKQQLYDAFLNEHLRLRMEDREPEEELIADVVLDGLSGFCASSARLLPDEPDAR